MTPSSNPLTTSKWQPFKNAFHHYARWLISISWKRFFVLSVLLMIASSILQSLPPFTLKYSERIEVPAEKISEGAKSSLAPVIRIERPQAQPEAQGKADASDLPAAATSKTQITINDKGIHIVLPAEVDSENFGKELEDKLNAWAAKLEARHDDREPQFLKHEVSWGNFLSDLALLMILVSMVIKITYKSQVQAEEKAAVATETAAAATETADAEQLKRQLAEARMATMQAQVEPHFLFNTLASIDHLIETDPTRASKMQKSLIALLRASLPAMRDNSVNNLRNLGQEIAVVQAYLDILKVRREERLNVQMEVPTGLYSAQMPSMMVQNLVENALKHGLEPKAEGGSLSLKAEVVDGRLVITVQDTGVGYVAHGPRSTAGTGFGLNNIRERLKLIYGDQAGLDIRALPEAQGTATGTLATLTLPYRTSNNGS